MILEALRIERRVILDQTRYFKINRTVKIFIWVHFLGMLTKVNLWPILKTKLQNSIQIHTKGLGSRADNPSSLICPFRT